MGQTHNNYLENSSLSQFKVIKINGKGHTLLKHNKDGTQYLLRSFSLSCQEEAKDFMQLLAKRKTISSINLLEIIQFSKKSQKQMCGVNYHINLLVQHPFRNLQLQFQQKRDKISEKRRDPPMKGFLKLKKKEEYFSQQQLLSILYSCTLALKQLYQNGLRHQCLRASAIFLDQNGLVKLGDPILLGLEQNYAIMLRQQFLKKKQKLKIKQTMIKTTELLNQRKQGIINKNNTGITLCQKSKDQMLSQISQSSSSQQTIKVKQFIDKFENVEENIHLSPQLLHFIENNSFYCYEKEKSDVFILGCILLETALLKNIKFFQMNSNSCIFNYHNPLEELMNLYPPKNQKYGIYGLIRELIRYQPFERPTFAKIIQIIEKQTINQPEQKQTIQTRHQHQQDNLKKFEKKERDPHPNIYQANINLTPPQQNRYYNGYQPLFAYSKISNKYSPSKKVVPHIDLASLKRFRNSPSKSFYQMRDQQIIVKKVEEENYSYKSWYLNKADRNSFKWNFIHKKVENTKSQFPNKTFYLQNKSFPHSQTISYDCKPTYDEQVTKKQLLCNKKPLLSNKQNTFHQLLYIPKNQELIQKLNSYPSLRNSLNVTCMSSCAIQDRQQIPTKNSDCFNQSQSGWANQPFRPNYQNQKTVFNHISQEKPKQSETKHVQINKQKITFGLKSQSNNSLIQQSSRSASIILQNLELAQKSQLIQDNNEATEETKIFKKVDKKENGIISLEEFMIKESQNQLDKQKRQKVNVDAILEEKIKRQISFLNSPKNISKPSKIQISSPEFEQYLSHIPAQLKKFISAQEFMSQPVVQSQEFDGKPSSQIIGVSLQNARASCNLKQAFSGMIKSQLLPPPLIHSDKQQQKQPFNQIQMSKKYRLLKSQKYYQKVIQSQKNERKSQKSKKQSILNFNQHYFIMAQSQALSGNDAYQNNKQSNISWSNTSQIKQQEEISYQNDSVSIKLQKDCIQQYEKENKLNPIQFFQDNSSIYTQGEYHKNSFQIQQKIMNFPQNWLSSAEKQRQSSYKQSPIDKLGNLNDQQNRQNNNVVKKLIQDTINEQQDQKSLTIIMQDSKQHKNSFFKSNQSEKIKTPDLLKHQINGSRSSQNSLNQEFNYVQEVYSDGSCYIGTTINGKRHGRGKMVFESGGCYDGQWKENKMYGYGRLFYQSGKLAFDGNWKNDQFHGQGCVYNQNPDQFSYIVIIDPVSNKQCRQFKSFGGRDFRLLQDRWVKYQGNFATDYKHGKGIITLSNGQIFEGQFQYDVVEGNGKFHKLNGQIMKGYWKQNIYQGVKKRQK